MKYTSLPEMFFEVCNRYKDEPSLHEKKEGEFIGITYDEFKRKVEYCSSGLISLGLQKDDKVSIYSENFSAWAVSDFSIMTCGGITVTIFPTLPAAQAKYILFHSESEYVFVGKKIQLEKVLGIRSELKNLKRIITFFDFDDPSFPEIMSFKKLLDIGKEDYPKNKDIISERINSINSDDVASFIYTSGTTGHPKGAMLTHQNFVSNVEVCSTIFPIDHKDIFLSFLPLSHVFERTAGHFLPIYIGASIYYAEKAEKVSDNLPEVRPTVMVSVPRLYEKMHEKVLNKVEKDSFLKRKIFSYCIKVGNKHSKALDKGKVNKLLKSRFKLADKLVFSKLKERVGGRIRFFISGGAALASEINEFFKNADLKIYEGYGLTETAPVIAANTPEKSKVGTVGLPIAGVNVKIAEDGEILVRGDNVMKGYYRDEIATKECIDEDGWFYTGDIGFFDDEGLLTITDRKKNIIVLDNGKNVAPQPIESLLLGSKYISQILLFGDERKFISGLIVPNFEFLKDYANSHNISYSGIEDIVKDEEITDLFKSEIETLSIDLANFEKVKRFTLLNGEFTIENGEMTPSLKLKRKVIEENNKDLIDKMYN
ncbi:AMP-dependent synthetase/ligase [candidate division KSB1 bacterium]